MVGKITRLFTCLLLISMMGSVWADIAKPVRVGIQLWPGYYPLLIAQHKGFFRELNLQVEYVLLEDFHQLSTQFKSKNIDLFCATLGDGFELYDHDPSSRVVMVINESIGADVLLVKHDLPASGTPIKIGTHLNGFGELFVRQYMQQHDLSDSDVQLVEQEAAQAMDMLRTGRADIVHTWEPYASELNLYYGSQTIFDSSQTPGLIIDTLFAHDDFLNSRPQDMKKFIAAWLKGAKWWLENRAEGDAYLESELLLLPGALSLKGIKLFTLAENIAAFSQQTDTQSVYETAKIYRDFFASKQAFKTLPLSAQDLVTGKYIPQR